MRQRAATAVFTALAWMLVYPAPSLAKPSRTPAGSVPRSLIASRPTSRERVLAHPDSRLESRRGAPATPRLIAVAAHTPRTPALDQETARTYTAAGVPSRLQPRLDTADQERVPAPHPTVAANTRSLRLTGRAGRRREIADSTLHYSFPALRETGASRPPADGAATGDEPSTLTNVGGILRSDPEPRGDAETQSLKSIEGEASTPVLLPSLYDSRGRLVVPPPLYGSREVLIHQNQMADREGLDRVRDDIDLLDLVREKKLVALPENSAIHIDERLPDNRRFSRPWTAAFLNVLARDFYASFHSPLQIDSAVRTVEFQQRLIRRNGNAAPAEGDTASPHLTGQAIDIAKRGLSLTQVAWMRVYLQPLIDQGKIDVEEEFQQACFHISVYKSYLPVSTPSVSVAAAGRLPAEPLP
jgi:hypothetical protein